MRHLRDLRLVEHVKRPQKEQGILSLTRMTRFTTNCKSVLAN